MVERTRPRVRARVRRPVRLEIDVPDAGRARACGRRNTTGCRRARARPECRARPARRAWRNGRSSSFTARSTVARRIVDPSATAQTEDPWVMLKECAKPSLSLLTTMLMSPCCQRVTAFERCRPAWAKPSRAAAPLEAGGGGLVHRELDKLDALAASPAAAASGSPATGAPSAGATRRA